MRLLKNTPARLSNVNATTGRLKSVTILMNRTEPGWESAMSGELPPRPERETGRPWPPQAPTFIEDRWRKPTPGRYKPQPPAAGMGPTLAWYQTSARGSSLGFVTCMLILGVVFSILFRLQGSDSRLFEWIESWQMWTFIALSSLFLSSPFKIERQAAGSDWFAWGHFRLYTCWRSFKWKYIYI